MIWTALLAFSAGSAYAAGNAVMTVSATILSKSICSFNTTAADLPFGTLDPLSPANKTVSASATFKCLGSAPIVVYAITQNNGLNAGPGGNRLRHVTDATAYIPYSLVFTPDAVTFPRETPPQNHVVTITGTILGTDYQTAAQGDYSDTVTLTINP